VTAPIPTFLDDLDETLAHVWRQFGRGVVDRRNSFHTPTLATLADDGTPVSRTLVLRGIDVTTRTLRLHTDVRSRKWAELAHAPRASLHVYDAGQKIQVRAAGQIARHTADAIAERAWANSRASSRACYAQDLAPGAVVPQPIAAPPVGTHDATAYRHFGVLLMAIDRIEWLYLAAAGHRRALFTWQGDAATAQWLAP
jgi:hypothetical protein